MSNDLANTVARRFIARADAKAKQYPGGEYKPIRVNSDRDSATIPWSRDNVLDHLSGDETFGHYFLDGDNTTKLFALDIDLEKVGVLPTIPQPVGEGITDEAITEWGNSFAEANPREAWRDRGHVGREYMKVQFRSLAGRLAAIVHKELEIECAVAYSGNKGIHVYGFTGRQSADEARIGAELVLQLFGDWKSDGRASTFKHPEYPNLSVEIYPKQTELTGGGFGNLMRLPLGKNLKAPQDPTFFVDLHAPMNVLAPADALWSLTTGAANPWADR